MPERPGPSRRAFLAGASAAVSGLLLAPLAACGAAGAELSSGVLATRHRKAPTRWRMAVPSTKPRGLMVALHGFGGSADSAFDLGLADSVERAGLALVSVDGGNGYWHARADGSDSGAMVREELIPLAHKAAGLAADSPAGLIGWSMGGFGGLLLASDLGPERVTNVVAVSAALWTKGSQTPAGAFDDREDFDRHSIFGRTRHLQLIPVRLDCGTSDPFIAANRLLATRLTNVTAHFGAGGHDANYWSGRAADQIAWSAAH